MQVRPLACSTAEQQHLGPALLAADVAPTDRVEPSEAELLRAARESWRRASRCVGRAGWSTLALRDSRWLTDPQRIAEDLVEHLRYATNGGTIRPTMTVLNPQVRVLNEQLVRYGDDPQYASFCTSLRRTGWVPRNERFEVLPLALYGPWGVSLHALPDDAVKQVPISHPTLPWFAELGLQWLAVPAISNMLLRIDASTVYPVVFNGWYVSDEISARNLAGPERYDVLPAVASRLGLTIDDDRDGYGRQRALIEVEAAVLWSFRRAGVKISSPQQEAQRFMGHLEREEAAGRPVPGDWSWVISPITPVLLPTYHRYYSHPEPGAGPDLVPDVTFGAVGRTGWHDQGCAG